MSEWLDGVLVAGGGTTGSFTSPTITTPDIDGGTVDGLTSLSLDGGLLFNDIESSLADDATTTLTDAKAGFCFIMCNGEMTGFVFHSDGTIIEAIAGTANVSYAASPGGDGNLCVYANGTQITIKNRLGSTQTVYGFVVYYGT